MSMDISIDEESWKSKSSSSTLNLTYERGESGGDGEHQVEEGGEDRREESHEEEQQEEEDTRRSPNRQRFKDEDEEDASDCEEEEDNEEQPAAEYQEEEEQKEDEGIMLCMPVATAQAQVSSAPCHPFLLFCTHDMFTNTLSLSLTSL